MPQLETAAKTDDGDNRKKVAAGDFVINSRSDRKGSAGLAKQDGSVSLINTVLTPLTGQDPLYFEQLLKSIPFQEEFYRYGKGIVADLWSTRYSEMRNITLAVPPLHEQTAIAAFLDRETAKIDALVEEQRRLIALLKEKRQAVISHAVTKGLNSSAPMKASGVEWLGDVPAHWEVRKLTSLTRLESGHTPSRQRPDYWVEAECVISWFTLADVSVLRDGRLDYVNHTSQRISPIGMENSAARLLPEQTVLLSRTASVGFSAVTAIELAVSQDFAAWICGS